MFGLGADFLLGRLVCGLVATTLACGFGCVSGQLAAWLIDFCEEISLWHIMRKVEMKRDDWLMYWEAYPGKVVEPPPPSLYLSPVLSMPRWTSEALR